MNSMIARVSMVSRPLKKSGPGCGRSPHPGPGWGQITARGLPAHFWHHLDPPVLVLVVLPALVTVSVTGTLNGAGRLGGGGVEFPVVADVVPELMVTWPV
jgi:hypothetical protein